MGHFRTKESAEKYRAFIAAGGLESGCRLCESPSIREFTHWRIIDNKFPYDRIAKTHHMILPIKHLSEAEITAELWMEYQQLKKGYLNEQYEFIIELTLKKRTIPAHFHLQLVVAQD